MRSRHNLITDSEKNLRFFEGHKNAFDIDNIYPLDLFEEFLKTQEDCIIDCSCKIASDRLYAARFTLSYLSGDFRDKINASLDFFRRVEGQVQATINYQLLQEFLGSSFNFDKIKRVLTGVDARPEVKESRLKLFIWIENYLEKQETAIKLCGDSQDLRTLMIQNNLLIGFDLCLDGRAEIELYPTLAEEELQQISVQRKLAKLLPNLALQLLENCHAIQIGFSKANPCKILYFHPQDPNYFIDNLGNEMAKRVHAYYRHQPVGDLVVAIPENELLGRSIHHLNLYYSNSLIDSK